MLSPLAGIFILSMATLMKTVDSRLEDRCSCQNVQCKEAINCTESVADICGCCLVCKRELGERCGGPYDIDGVCAKDLVCVAQQEDMNAVCRSEAKDYLHTCQDKETKKSYLRNEHWTVGCLEHVCLEGDKVFTRNVTCSALEKDEKGEDPYGCFQRCVPEPTTRCEENSMTLEIPKQLLVDIPSNSFSLISSECKGEMNSTHLVFRSPLHKCGTIMIRDKGYVTYRNSVQRLHTSTVAPSDRRKFLWPFSCSYPIKRTISVAVKIRENKVLTILIRFTSKGGRILKKLDSLSVSPGERVYVAVFATGIPKVYGISTRIRNCFLADSPILGGIENMYTIVKHSCPAKRDVHVLRVFDNGIWFSFPVTNVPFDLNKPLSLHCNAILCPEEPVHRACKINKCSHE